MAADVVMPRLSLTMKEGTVGKWYKKEGDSVEKGEPIAEIVSEKATYDLEAPESGIVRKILTEAGVDAPVNAVLAIITSPNEPLPETVKAAETPKVLAENEKRVLTSPAARRLAREHGIDLSTVKGSGPEGRIDEDDVAKLVQSRREVSVKVKEVVPLSGLRKTSAERLSMSFGTAPHSTIAMEVDVSKAADIHDRLEVSYSAIIVKAVGSALRDIPIMNSTLEVDRVKIFDDVNVGIAVATENGLIVPVIRNTDQKTLKEIEMAILELIEKAKQGKLSRKEVTGGTFTVTNLGMYGVDFFIPIINPPEAAILAIGRIADKAVAVNGKVELRPMMTLSLAFDHRIVDGAPAAEFLRSVKAVVENPESLRGH